MQSKAKHKILCIFGLCLFAFLPLCAQSPDSLQILPVPDSIAAGRDSVFFLGNEGFVRLDSLSQKEDFKPDPGRVLWMSAIFPGYGQFLNRQYWKIPIVYAGFLACGYAISTTNMLYHNYKIAYRDIIDSDPATNSFLDILPRGYTIESIGGKQQYATLLKTRQDQYRRFRDLSIIVSIAYYGLTILEAYVSAQLFEFDISTDLSLSVKPALLPQHRQNIPGAAPGMQICFNLK